MIHVHTLLGIAIGDAFGAGVEFQDRHWIRSHVDFTQLINARSSIQVEAEALSVFIRDYHEWDYTDDTEMTIGLIRALLSDKPFSEDLLVQEFKAEYERGLYAKGHGRNGHGSIRWYYEGEQSIEEIRSFQETRPNPGNAPAMRAVPLGFLPGDLINEYARINACSTHPHPYAIMSSQCIARAAEFLLLKGGAPADLIPYCLQKITFDRDFESYLAEVDQLPPYEELMLSHFAQLCGPQPIEPPYFLPGIHGLPSDSKYTSGAVLYVLKHSSGAMDALKKAIWLGGDVDSVASICTGIMAGRMGIGDLPNYMLEEVEGKAYLTQVANEWAEWLGKSYWMGGSQ